MAHSASELPRGKRASMGTMSAQKVNDPAWRRERAAAGGRAAQTLPVLISRIERREDELTDEDRERLARLSSSAR